MVHFFIKTYGCQTNVADSSHLSRYPVNLGCVEAKDESAANLLLINTCAIREKAEHKMFSYLGSLAGTDLLIGVIGCVASYRQKEIKRRFPYVDFVFSAKENIEDLKALLADKIELIATKERVCGKAPRGTLRSMINIMRGCNNYCSYCIVPFTTGRERSYPMSGIVEQVQQDVEAGAKEIVLLGQNVNSYKDPETGAGFEMLLERVAQVPGEFWVKFVSPHPKDMTVELIDVIAKHKKLCSFIHLPLQSGSNSILKRMNRTYTVEEYRALVDLIRVRLPNVVLTTDIIVGFPGETQEDYLATRKVVEEVRFQMIYSFIYSPRKYTKAAEFHDDCPPEVKQGRLQDLQALHRKIGTEINKAMIGKTVRVLLEDGKVGRTEGNVRVFVKGVQGEQRFVDVLVEGAQLSDISGVYAEKQIKSCQNLEKHIE